MPAQDDKSPLTRRFVVLGLLLVALIVCLSIYGLRGNKFAETQPAGSFAPELTNPEVLQNWLPESSLTYTIDRIDNYLQAHNLEVSYMTIKGSVTINEAAFGTYNFTIVLEPQNQTHHVSVAIDNFGGIISAAVSIDGQLQNLSLPSQSDNGTRFSGFSTLVSQGVTAPEINGLEAAFQKYAPSAASISINSKSVAPAPYNPNETSSTISYTFSVSIDNTTYTAKLYCPSLTTIELILNDSINHQQVFDSGLINSQG